MSDDTRRALIVVDVQNDFCEGGSLPVSGGTALAVRVAEVVASRSRDTGGYDAVLATRDRHVNPGTHFSDDPDFSASWPEHCVVGTPGADLCSPLQANDFDAVFNKGDFAAAYSGFEGFNRDVALADWLHAHGITDVDVCGIATDYCVKATALDAVEQGFTTRVLRDLVVGVAVVSTAEAFDELAAAGVEFVD